MQDHVPVIRVMPNQFVGKFGGCLMAPGILA
jgi:hypothetical protein